jgi:sulfate adenylyltransferase (ADP) / ATP adenylyltransferase
MTSQFLAGFLWPQIQQVFTQAMESGALQPIPTAYDWIEQDGVQFLVRIVDSLRRKELVQARQNQGILKVSKKQPDFNPFLPYEPDLFVSDLSPTHLVLLNKFNVMDHHVLIVTRVFERQSSWLNLQDFEALYLVMQDLDGFAFYNGGTLAGASQRHKHLQIVPTPLAPGGPSIPFAPWIDRALESGFPQVPQFPFRHRIASISCSASDGGSSLLEVYTQLMTDIDMGQPLSTDQPEGAYNLLITREWMMAVPRSQEGFEKISINSLGFAGAILVKSEEQLEQLKVLGPMTLLKIVGF